MNDYEAKQEARKARYESLARASERESEERYARAGEMESVIPFGQPVHGSRDRRYRERIAEQMGRGFQAEEKAEYYRQKAEAVGTAGISGYDPDAIPKLEAKLKELTELQERRKAVNRAVRLKDTEKGNAKLKEMGYTEGQIRQLREPGFTGEIGYPSYTMSGYSANIRRIKQRIEQLQEMQKLQENAKMVVTSLYRFVIADSRVQFIFDGKPEMMVRNILKRYSFKWSPSRQAWVRQATQNGLFAAECVRGELDRFTEGGRR